MKILRLALLPLLAAACGDEAPSDLRSATPAAAPAAAGPWAGEVTGGYKGNRLTFVLDPASHAISDVTFQGHWDCEDGIESTTLGPEGSFPAPGGAIEVVSVDPPDGGATALRFEMRGRLQEARAEGTLRINLNALGCDAGLLSWSATPQGG